jgi:hypothetical protein
VVYLLIFSGFWFMFNALFDVLPAHIEDWVDTRDIVRTLFGPAAPERGREVLHRDERGRHRDPAGGHAQHQRGASS